MDGWEGGFVGFLLGFILMLVVCIAGVWGYENAPGVYTGTITSIQPTASNGALNYKIAISTDSNIIGCNTSQVPQSQVTALTALKIGGNVTIVQDAEGHCVVFQK